MRFSKIKIAIVIIAALSMPLNAEAQEKKISINSRSKYSAPTIIVRSKFNFDQPISLKMKTDPALSASDALIRTISKFNMVDARGIKITSGFDIDLVNNLIVAFSGGISEIIKTTRNPTGFNVIASFKDNSGNFISPPANSLAVYTINGEKLCFEYKTIQQASPKIGIAILLDRSGSMSGEMESVKTAAQDFLNALPSSAECAVGSFNTELSYAHKNYQSCSGGGFGFETIEASGGTDIFKALHSAYSDLSGSHFSGYQKAAIVITDGYTINDEALKTQLLAQKKDILTFVYFIGGDKKDDLEQLTDHFISQGGDVKQSLSQYFGVIEQAYNNQKVLSVHSCQGGNHGTP